MALIDALIDDLASRFKLGSIAAPLTREALALIVGADGGITGFLDLFKRAGLGGIAGSWLGQTNPAPLTASDLEKALGAPAIDSIAHRLGLALPAVSAGLSYALPRLVGLLTPNGAIPETLPAEIMGFFGAPAGNAPGGDDHGHADEVKKIRTRSVAPGWLWPVVAVAAVAGLGWAVWPILFPSHPPEATTTQSAAPAAAPAPAVAEAPKPAPAPTTPSTFAVHNDNGVAVISGAVHDDQTRGSILDALKGVFGADKIKGDVAVDANRTSAPWLPNVRAALEALKIPGVSAAFEGETVKVGGAIVDADRETITASLKALLGNGATIGGIADAFAGVEASANSKTATALGSLQTGFTGDDLVAVLNQAMFSFPYGKADLPASVQGLLGDVSASLKKLPPGYQIEVAGYTDNAGDPNAMVALSQQRVDAVRDALVKGGAPADLLVPKGYGGADPVASNDTEEGRLRNRRIEFHVLKKPSAAPAAVTAQAPAAPASAASPTTPSTLSIDDDNGVANISGAVHDDQTRGSILDALRGAFGADHVKGDVTVDPTRGDAPWLAHLRAALDTLKVPGLQAVFEGGALKLGGAIPDVDRDKIAAALGSVFGGGVAVSPLGEGFGTMTGGEKAATTAPAPAAAASVTPAAPSMLSIDDENGVAAVSGSVHDDQTRGSILDALKAAFGADNVRGDVSVDPTRADAPWLANLRGALDALKVPGLKATYEGGSVKLGGAIPDADREKIAASLKSVFGEGITVASLAPSIGEWESSANARAAAALGALKTGYTAADVVTALNLSVVNFATDSAAVPESVIGLLHDAAASLKVLPQGYVIEIAGYTDNTGDPDGNLVLSRQRAESVRAMLIKDGAPEDMLTAKGYGAADPIDSNDTEEGRLHNRRIEYHVTKTP